MQHHHYIWPDLNGLFLIAGSWGPLLAISLNAATIALVMSIAVSILAVIDYCMKIHWKFKQIRKDRREKREKNEDTTGADRG